jgi:hypothetical protein
MHARCAQFLQVEFYELVLAAYPRLRPFAPTYLGCVDMSLAEIEAVGASALSLDDANEDSDEQQCGSLGDPDSPMWALDMEGSTEMPTKGDSPDARKCDIW